LLFSSEEEQDSSFVEEKDTVLAVKRPGFVEQGDSGSQEFCLNGLAAATGEDSG
jgi:hypothetical protein